MNFISIHDTHRLPYNNATITAKRVQEGDTTPLKFFNAVDEEPLGYEVYTNARGYICDRDGNLYTKGVFVREDAYVTATLGDGASTSWIVKPDSDVAINDGELLGRIEDNQAKREQEEREGKEFVLFNGHWHLKLHSANTPDNRTLPLKDLDGVPAFNEWKEVEQVAELKTNQTTVVVEEYTKVLVLQWSGTKPANHNVVTISVDTQVVDGRHRYAQHCLVYNQTGMRVVLKNVSSPQSTIGIIAPNGTMNMGLFFLESSTVGEWIADDRYADWDDGLDANQAGGSLVYVEGIPTAGPTDNNMFQVKITDRTPNVLHIVARNINFGSASPKPGEIKIKLTGDHLTKARNITVWFANNDVGEAEHLPAMFYSGDYYTKVFELYPATLTEIRVPTTGIDFTPDNNIILLDNADRPLDNAVYKSSVGGGSFRVPQKCDLFMLNTTGNGSIVRVVFTGDENYYTRLSVTVASGFTRLQLVNDSDAVVQKEYLVCTSGNFGVRNSKGLLYVDGDTVECDYSGNPDSDGIWYADMTAHFANKIDFTRMGQVTGTQFGNYTSGADNPKNDLYIKMPLSSTQDGVFEIEFTNYASHTKASRRLIRFYLRSTDGTDYSITDLMDTVDSIFVNGGRYKFSKSGAVITRIG